jgi:predicted Zn finger-like uncharacterized protein
MSAWATRCKSCGTSFRVTEEQLAISEGYARCGRCDAVFNARATLFDLDAPASVPMPLQPMAPTPIEPEPAAEPAAAVPPTPVEEPRFEPTTQWSDTAADVESGVTREPVWQASAEAPSAEHASPQRQEPDAARMMELLGAASADPAPAATWSSLRSSPPAKPKSRALLALGGAGLAALLLALPVHWAWIERDALRAQHPVVDAWMRQALPQVPSPGWRHLDGLAVSSSSLRATPQGGAYQLELVVQNRAPHPLAMPWLDLSLSDAKGQALLRKAVDPASLQLPGPLAPNEQRRIQAVFRLAASGAVSGYEIGLFHP